jgi:ATP-dependent DNA helicase RecG
MIAGVPTDVELESLLGRTESDLAERKESLAHKDRICEAICAFANDLPCHAAPGVIFVGARDDGTPTNLAITDGLLRELSDLRSNGNIYPFPTITVQTRALHGADMAVVTVEPSPMPPVRFKGQTWIRVGPRRAIATPEEERRLIEKRRAATLPFDIQPVTSASLDDLDIGFFERAYLPAAFAPDVLEQNQRTIQQRLASLRFMTREEVPTVLGLLVLGIEPTEHVPGAYVQVLRIEGSDLADPIRDHKVLRGPMSQQLRELDELLPLNVSVAVSATSGPVEVQRPDYPLQALVQLARNALLHRTYEGTNAPVRITWFADRVEIQSPGGPFGQVTPENIGQPGVVDYRNPNLADAMHVLGFVQRFGIGIQLARRELERNGNPALEFEANAGTVLVILRPA